jgi:hypothetical protein
MGLGLAIDRVLFQWKGSWKPARHPAQQSASITLSANPKECKYFLHHLFPPCRQLPIPSLGPSAPIAKFSFCATNKVPILLEPFDKGSAVSDNSLVEGLARYLPCGLPCGACLPFQPQPTCLPGYLLPTYSLAKQLAGSISQRRQPPVTLVIGPHAQRA